MSADRIGRREFIRRTGLAATSLPLAAVLVACEGGQRIPVGETENAALPIHPDAPPLPPGLRAERDAVLRILQWKEYLAGPVIDAFRRRYAFAGVRADVQSFDQIDQGVAKLAEPGADFDIFFPTIDVLPRLVTDRLLRPLNHDYLPHLPNLWPQFRGASAPFYDPGQRYTVPYTVYSSGIGWRSDLVHASDSPDAQSHPFDILWDRRYRGRLGFYDNFIEALSLALLRNGVNDVAGADDAQLRDAADALRLARHRADVRFTTEGAEEGLPEGEFVAHQAWSGDIMAAGRYAYGDRARTASLLRYWSPEGHDRIVGCDLIAVCARGRNPVLAHAFIDHLLRFDVAMDNFSWNGYQPPLEGVTREAFADRSFRWHASVPSNLVDALLSPASFGEGQFVVGLAPSQRARWLAQWNRVVPRT